MCVCKCCKRWGEIRQSAYLLLSLNISILSGIVSQRDVKNGVRDDTDR